MTKLWSWTSIYDNAHLVDYGEYYWPSYSFWIVPGTLIMDDEWDGLV